MSLGHLPKIVASLLLALYLMGPGSVIVHILEENSSCGHAEEPIHLEQPEPVEGAAQSGPHPCNICEQGDKMLPGAVLVLAHPFSISAHIVRAVDIVPLRCGDPPFIPPELHGFA